MKMSPKNKPEYQAHILSPKITAELKAVSASESIGSIPRVSDLIKQLLVGSGCQSVKKFPTDVKILLPRYLQRNSNEIFIELDDP